MIDRKRCGIIAYIIILAFIISGCTSKVTNKEITIKVGEDSLTGTYTGTMTDGKPDGEGEFIHKSDDRTYEYNGFWKNGNVSKNGNLKDTKYTVNFSHVSRIGEYSGEVLNGIASGQGTFVAVNDDGEKYTYTGSWRNGLWNGQGEWKYEDEESFIQKGNFKDGEFAPTKLEFIQYFGTGKDMNFAPTDKAVQFIKEHDNFFPADNSTDITPFLDTSIQYKNLIKNPGKYGDKIIQLKNYEILQIWEADMWGYTLTSFLACSSNYDDYVYGYYLGELPDKYEGSKINISGLPINNSSFENTAGGTTLCYIIYGCKIS